MRETLTHGKEHANNARKQVTCRVCGFTASAPAANGTMPAHSAQWRTCPGSYQPSANQDTESGRQRDGQAPAIAYAKYLGLL